MRNREIWHSEVLHNFWRLKPYMNWVGVLTLLGLRCISHQGSESGIAVFCLSWRSDIGFGGIMWFGIGF